MATFCLVHGAWHDGSCWEPLIASLSVRGHAAVAPDLPLDDPRAGFEQRVRPALSALEDIAGAPIVVGHSAGSAYAALVAAALPGSLLVYLCPRLGPFAPPPDAPGTFRKGFRFPADGPDGTSAWDAEAAVAALYGRLPPTTARRQALRLRPLAPAAGEYPLAAHPDVPTVLVYAAEDEIFEPAWERFMAREVLRIEPIEIRGGHFPMLEDPELLAGLLDHLARGHEGE